MTYRAWRSTLIGVSMVALAGCAGSTHQPMDEKAQTTAVVEKKVECPEQTGSRIKTRARSTSRCRDNAFALETRPGGPGPGGNPYEKANIPGGGTVK